MTTKSELEADFLLNECGIIVFPESIDGTVTLDWLIARLEYMATKGQFTPKIYFRSDGGDSRVGLAMANYIKQHGNVHGYMIGDTFSSAATVWASCAKRFVWPTARMGIHPVRWIEPNASYDHARLLNLYEDFMDIDKTQCQIYEQASNQSYSWWWGFYTSPGDVKYLDAANLVAFKMAEIVSDKPASDG